MIDLFSNNLEEDTLWDAYNLLLFSPDIDRIRKLLVRYELFKLSLDVPGDIIECGVFKGAGLMYWLKLLAIYSSGSLKRVIGFDTFEYFATSLESYEVATVDRFVQESKFKGIDPSVLMRKVSDMGFGDRVELIKGDLTETASQYVNDNPGFRISLLHLDVDLKQGTQAALENFYPLVSRSGVIILDEYACRGFGESDAVDEYFADKDVHIRSVPFSKKPMAYIIKP
jgi:hypothetical protein